ncbi:hypothetical protein AmaxDRAFT_2626 [Limnospira maxima CS-328]|uniref:Uncharacterized protein n=1 Tax=Limnospira maxima CS-328 TaxID=513049 RepID=B5W1I0_LIMMA|nr:hypothetical protein AmaxDRAFT_2626 [Limnospira maxima CS-328]
MAKVYTAMASKKLLPLCIVPYHCQQKVMLTEPKNHQLLWLTLRNVTVSIPR